MALIIGRTFFPRLGNNWINSNDDADADSSQAVAAESTTLLG